MVILKFTMLKKILIIKLGALGDVLRTRPILKGIKEKHPESEIWWITKPSSREVLEDDILIDKILTLPIIELNETFDELYNFDIEEEATSLAKLINANKKYGFSSEQGFVSTFNFPAEYYLNTMFDDETKKTNKKTYQEIMFNTAELPYKKQHTMLDLSEQDKQYAKEFIEKNNINLNNKKLIGIHIGSSSRWPSRSWTYSKIKDFIIKAKQKEYEVLLFGGSNEKTKQERVIRELNNQGINIFRNNPDNTIKQFASLVNICDKMVCSDSLSLHVSLALKKPTICLFFCTPYNEIEGYGILKKIKSPLLYDFFPERMDEYNEELMNSISVDEVINVLEEETSKTGTQVVNAIIKNNENYFLAIKRKSSVEGIHPGKWAFPGGIVESGETAEQALKREIKEELGLKIKKIIKKISNYIYKRPDNSQTTGTSYLIEVEDSQIIPSEEIEDFKWVTIEEFENMDYVEGLDEEAMKALFENNNKNT